MKTKTASLKLIVTNGCGTGCDNPCVDCYFQVVDSTKCILIQIHNNLWSSEGYKTIPQRAEEMLKNEVEMSLLS